jgi:hypothetical protein
MGNIVKISPQNLPVQSFVKKNKLWINVGFILMLAWGVLTENLLISFASLGAMIYINFFFKPKFNGAVARP